MDSTIAVITAKLGLPCPADAAGFVTLQQVLALLLEPPAKAAHWLRMDPESVAVRAQLALRALERLARLQQLSEESLIEWTDAMNDEPWEDRLACFQQASKGRLPWLRSAFRSDQRLRRQLLPRAQATHAQWIRVLEQACERAKLNRWFRNHEATFQERFETDYDGQATDWTALCGALQWVERLQALLEAKPVPDGITVHMQQPAALATLMNAALDELRVMLGTS